MQRAQYATLAFVLALTFLFGISSRSSEAASLNIGYVHPVSFGSTPGGDVTADKPQSKLWYTTEGGTTTWWAVMFNGSVGQWRIHKLTWPGQWADTGVTVDNRATSRADVLWDNNTKKLYIVSLVRLSSSNQSRLYRYTYSGGIYTPDSGYPVVVMKTDPSTPDPVTGSAETMAFDKDSTGRLWITFTQNKKVYVNTNPDDGKDWGKPFVLPTSVAVGSSDDISSLVAYNDRDGPSIGVLWSSHSSTSSPSTMNFSYHKDGDPINTWQPVESIYGGNGAGTCLADDHINLKSLQAEPSGTIFAAVKTSVGDSSSCTGGTDLIRLLVRNPTTNAWKWAAFGGKAENHTRPIVLLDTSKRKVYMFATSPEACGIIYMKISNMDNPSFPAGKGTAFISSANNTCINNATSTKQAVNANTGLVVMASDKNSQNYLHNILLLGSDTGTPTTVATNTATPTTAATNTPTATPAPGSTATATSTPTTPPSGGTRLKDITFEGGSLTDPTSGADAVFGTVAPNNSTPLKGAYSATINTTSGYLREDFSATDELFVSFYLKAGSSGDTLATAFPANARVALIGNVTAGSTTPTTVGTIFVTTSGTLQLKNATTTIGSASPALTPGTIYRIGLHQKKGTGGNAVLEAYLAIGDAAFTTPFSSSATQTFTTQATRLSVGATNSNAVNATVDDIRIDTGIMP